MATSQIDPQMTVAKMQPSNAASNSCETMSSDAKRCTHEKTTQLELENQCSCETAFTYHCELE